MAWDYKWLLSTTQVFSTLDWFDKFDLTSKTEKLDCAIYGILEYCAFLAWNWVCKKYAPLTHSVLKATSVSFICSPVVLFRYWKVYCAYWFFIFSLSHYVILASRAVYLPDEVCRLFVMYCSLKYLISKMSFYVKYDL